MERSCVHCTVIPPYIYDQLARNGTPDERAAAVDALQLDASIRALRLQASLVRAPGRASADLGADPAARKRQIFDCHHAESPSGPLVRGEGAAAVADVAVNEAYDGLGATWDFYAQAYSRDSIDDEGLGLDAYVHFGNGYNNAFWDGRRMVFGDGDGRIFNRFTASIDVIGHELTHGVTQDEAGLIYLNQPGALNESMSDVFGSLVKQHSLGQTADQADWLIGQGLWAAGIKGAALRSMKAPGTAYDDPRIGKDPQPDHMSKFVNTTRDNGGVHINSGIPNRAFYLAAAALGGHAWEQAGLIWYDALRSPRLRPTSGFKAFARITVQAATARFGDSSKATKAVTDAWATVGIKV